MRRFNFYATLLDGFQNYLSSSEIYHKYYTSDDPKLTEEEFEEKQFWNLIDRINRVPLESEAADRGTTLNEVIDCLIENRKPSEGFDFKSFPEHNKIAAAYKNYVFEFPLDICLKLRDIFNGALTQERVEAELETKYGTVLLYGYIDELMPTRVHDLKLTKSYSAFKFKNHWQHIVYPYCLTKSGIEIYDFEYTITDLKNIYREQYTYVPERDIPILLNHVENLIEFLDFNRELITDKKIFNEQLPDIQG